MAIVTKKFRLEVVVNGDAPVFDAELGKGVLGFKGIYYTLEEEKFKEPMFAAALLDEMKNLQAELVSVRCVEIK